MRKKTNKETIKFSVIIPHYNDLAGLKQLIPTIPNQPNIEIIIVDDNSFDDERIVRDAVRSFNYNNILLAFNDKSKRGAGGCRNKGLELARGKWIIFSDADDFFTEKAFESFDSYWDSFYDVVFFHMTSLNLNDRTLGTRHLQYEKILNRYHKNPSKNNELGLRYNLPSPWAKMIKKNLIVDNNILFDDVRWSNDDMFSARVGYFAKTVEASKDIVYCVTRDDGTITTSKSEEAIKVSINIYIRKILFLKEKLSYPEFRKSIRWPGNKIILLYLDRYERKIIEYLKEEYKRNKISLFWINRYDLNEFGARIKSYFTDRKYTKFKKNRTIGVVK